MRELYEPKLSHHTHDKPSSLTLNEGSIASARRYASSAASGSPSCPRHKAIMFQSALESTLDLTTSLKSSTARLKYRSCDVTSTRESGTTIRPCSSAEEATKHHEEKVQAVHKALFSACWSWGRKE